MTMRNSVKTLIDSDVKKLVSGDELHGQDLEPCSLPEWVAANPLAAYLHTIANIVSEETESAAERALRCAQRCLDGPALYRATSFVLGCPLLRAPGRLRGTAHTRISMRPECHPLFFTSQAARADAQRDVAAGGSGRGAPQRGARDVESGRRDGGLDCDRGVVDRGAEA